MKKNILSFFKNTYTKSFIIGLALAFIISFSIHSVIASSQTLPFLPQQSGLVNKIGSLTVGYGVNHSASWIDPNSTTAKKTPTDELSCMSSAPGVEKETCLDVQGTGAFSKLLVLDGMPTYIIGDADSLLALSNYETHPNVQFSDIVAGLPRGFILNDDGGDDSIMATGLQRNDSMTGQFAPVDTTSVRGLCADATGKFYPCDIGQPVETYHWDLGAWGNCSAATESSCDGNYTVSGSCSGGTYTITANGTCTGDGYESVPDDDGCSGDCNNGQSEDTVCADETTENNCIDFNNYITSGNCYGECGGTCEWESAKVDWNGDPMNWVEGQEYIVDPDGNGGCDSGFDGGTPPLYKYTVICSNGDCKWKKYVESNECNNTGGGCTWYCESDTTYNFADAYGSSTNTYQCSDVSSQSSCTSHGCTWNNGSTVQCSTSNPQSENECTSQNAACIWTEGGTSTKTRTVTCKDSSNQTVSNQLCIDAGLTPDIDVNNDGVPDTTTTDGCGNNNNNNNSGETGQCGEPPLRYNSQPVCLQGSSSNFVVHTENCTSNGSEYNTWDCGSGSGLVHCETSRCFVADTLVTMADGTTKNIQDVKIGEKVLGNNGEVSEVKGIHKPLLGDQKDNKIYSFNGGRYFVTAEHPFMTTEGWKAIDPIWSMEEHPEMSSISYLKVGDTLITENGKVTIETIDYEEREPSTQLYNLKLGGNHTYYADGYLVHNLKCATN